jgi:hypothetical protein
LHPLIICLLRASGQRPIPRPMLCTTSVVIRHLLQGGARPFFSHQALHLLLTKRSGNPFSLLQVFFRKRWCFAQKRNLELFSAPLPRRCWLACARFPIWHVWAKPCAPCWMRWRSWLPIGSPATSALSGLSARAIAWKTSACPKPKANARPWLSTSGRWGASVSSPGGSRCACWTQGVGECAGAATSLAAVLRALERACELAGGAAS